MTYNFKQVKILIVEESQPITDITRSILKSFEITTVHVAANSDRAFEIFNEENHDIILMDWMVAPLNGIELTEKIRKDKHSPNPFVPIILMTGFSDRKRVTRARDAGITEFLAKPFTAHDLYRRIDQIISKPRPFVKAPDFFGPDRRRKIITEGLIPRRREEDME